MNKASTIDWRKYQLLANIGLTPPAAKIPSGETMLALALACNLVLWATIPERSSFRLSYVVEQLSRVLECMMTLFTQAVQLQCAHPPNHSQSPCTSGNAMTTSQFIEPEGSPKPVACQRHFLLPAVKSKIRSKPTNHCRVADMIPEHGHDSEGTLSQPMTRANLNYSNSRICLKFVVSVSSHKPRLGLICA